MLKVTIVNTGENPVKLLNVNADVDITVAPGTSVAAEVPNGTVLIDLQGIPEATLEGLKAWQFTGNLGD